MMTAMAMYNQIQTAAQVRKPRQVKFSRCAAVSDLYWANCVRSAASQCRLCVVTPQEQDHFQYFNVFSKYENKGCVLSFEMQHVDDH
jgi:hypothetical protein